MCVWGGGVWGRGLKDRRVEGGGEGVGVGEVGAWEWGVGGGWGLSIVNLVPLCLVGLMLAPETLRAASPGASLKLPPGARSVPA